MKEVVQENQAFHTTGQLLGELPEVARINKDAFPALQEATEFYMTGFLFGKSLPFLEPNLTNCHGCLLRIVTDNSYWFL